MIKAILFDLDGTLINTNRLILNSFKHAFKNHLNIEIEDKEIIKFFGEPLIRSMGRFGEENKDALIKSFREFNESMHDTLATSFDGVDEAIRALKDRGIKLGIVTSKREKMTLRSLKLIKLYEYIDVIITPESTEKHKPEPEPIYKACSILNISVDEVIMVGDSIYDIQCGKNAGCQTCAVTYTEFSLEELKELKPDYIVDNLIELIQIVDIIDKKQIS